MGPAFGAFRVAETARLMDRVRLTSVTGAAAPSFRPAQSPGEANSYTLEASRTEFKSNFYPFTGCVTLNYFVISSVCGCISEKGE